MPTLDEILRQTLFTTAGGPTKEVDLGTTGTFSTDDFRQIILAGRSGSEEDQALWTWFHDALSLNDLNEEINTVTGDPDLKGKPFAIDCLVPEMRHEMPVLTDLKWQDTAVSKLVFDGTHNQEVKVQLPLTRRFLLRRSFLPEGHVRDNQTDPFWRLEMKVDCSLMLVFGYDVNFTNQITRPLANVNDPAAIKSVTSQPNFMSDFTTSPDDAIAPVGSDTEVRVSMTRVIVALQFVCCKQRDEFDPNGMLQSARIFPLIMMMANRPLHRMFGSVRFTRPRHTFHTRMDHEEMTPDIGQYYFTDCNDSPILAIKPHWDYFFDYYMTDPPKQTFTMVHPTNPAVRLVNGSLSDGQRTIRGAINKPFSVSKDFLKVAGQGEFDNVHMAPRMIASPALRRRYPDFEFDSIVMAPFCVHDCLHMHWRWSTEVTDKWVLGWDGFVPYQKAGAPLVPPNQKITMTNLSGNALLYTAEIFEPMGNQWQVILHHGAGYGLSTTKRKLLMFEKLLTAEDAKDLFSLDKTWASFYWHLRFDLEDDRDLPFGPPKRTERVHITDMDRCRELK